jgi:2'-5' RNA ligase
MGVAGLRCKGDELRLRDSIDLAVHAAMTEQLSFDGFTSPPVRPDKLLYAIYPDAPTAAVIEGCAQDEKRTYGLTGSLRPTEVFHITLCHIDDYDGLPAGIVDRAKEAAAKVTAHSFEITLDRAVSFRGNGAFVLCEREGEIALKDFRQSLYKALKADGPRCQAVSSFTPHVTLLYDKHLLVPEHPVVPISWTVREFVLVHSPFGESKHIPLTRWPLQD